IVIAVEVDDAALADRLTSLLGGVRGLRLAVPGETPTVALGSRGAQAPAEPTSIDLPPREPHVLPLLSGGASTESVARQPGISVHTAKFHVGSLLQKLEASGRTDAVTHAARRGVINL